MPASRRVPLYRIVAAPAAIDGLRCAPGTVVLRIAADEALVLSDVAPVVAGDAWALVEPDTGWAAEWLDPEEAVEFLAHACDWELPTARPALAQGLVAGLPAKVWFERDRVLLLTPAAFAAEMAGRRP